MSLKRKLVVGSAALLVAGGAAGAGLAASGHASATSAPRQLRLASVKPSGFLLAAAQYLGTDVATLRHESKGGERTLAQIADATPGRSAEQLSALLVAAASERLQTISDRPMSTVQQQALARLIRPRITGFLNDACPLALGALARHLVGCPGMNG